MDKVTELTKIVSFLANELASRDVEIGRLKKAIELALYYVDGDSGYEIAKHRVDEVVNGAS